MVLSLYRAGGSFARSPAWVLGRVGSHDQEEEMDAGERTTRTRDEHYGLISVLYHALHGAENSNTYALDAEATGEAELSDFFREAGVVQARLAERAKGLLGITEKEIPPEGVGPAGAAPEDVPPSSSRLRSGEVPPPVEEASPATAATAADASRLPPDEDFVVPEEVPPDASQAGVDGITPEDFDPTISALEGGIVQLAIGRAVAEIETWERKLEATGDPELQAIAGNLGALRGLLTADDLRVAAAGPLLTTLGEQVREAASGEVGTQVADKLRRLSELLTSEGRSLSG